MKSPVTSLASWGAAHLLCHYPSTLCKALEKPEGWGKIFMKRVFRYWVCLESCLKDKDYLAIVILVLIVAYPFCC